MKTKYERVIEENNPEEVKKLLIEYYDAFKKIQEVDSEEHPWNEFWMDESTPLGLFLSMTVDYF